MSSITDSTTSATSEINKSEHRASEAVEGAVNSAKRLAGVDTPEDEKTALANKASHSVSESVDSAKDVINHVVDSVTKPTVERSEEASM